MQRLGGADGIRERVGDSVIHCRQSRGVWISNPSHLNWRGLAREHQQSVQASMARQVNQNIYGVRLNHSRQLIIGNGGGHAPICHRGLHALGGVVNAGFVVVAKHFKLVGVVRGKNRLNEFSNRVVVEIWRHIANAQTAFGICERTGASLRLQRVDIHAWNKTFKLVAKLFVLLKYRG